MACDAPSSIEAYAASVISRTWRACSAVRTGSRIAEEHADEVSCPRLDDGLVVVRDVDPVLPPFAGPRAVVVDVQIDRIVGREAGAPEAERRHRKVELEPRGSRARRAEAREQLAQRARRRTRG